MAYYGDGLQIDLPTVTDDLFRSALDGFSNERLMLMDRRTFIKSSAATCVAAGVTGGGLQATPSLKRGCATPAIIMTVTGPIAPEEMGQTLPHEHVLVDFAGVDTARPRQYSRREVFEVARPYLRELASAGGQTLVECTPAYLGRDPALLRKLSEATGVQILTNTGYYGARDDQHVPRHAYSDLVDRLAQRWIREWESGIGDTEVRPGFIKIGVDSGALSEIDRKLVRAACRAHLATGLTLAVHTGPARLAFEQLEVLAEEGVDPSAWIWVHAQNENDLARHVEAGREGAWVEFDGYGPERTERYVKMVATMRDHGLLDRVLLSHDNGWYSVGEPGGGAFAPYTPLFTDFLPALREAGFSQEEIHQLMVLNPAQAFQIRVRAARGQR